MTKLIKYFNKMILMTILFFSINTIASNEKENALLSGTYEILSCEPECSQIKTNSIRGNWDFSQFNGLTISIVDKPLQIWSTCDGSGHPFEFNLWPFGPETQALGLPFIHTNIEQSLDSWKKVCDGDFEISGNIARINAPSLSIELLKRSDENFELNWRDRRNGDNLSGKLYLKKRTY